MGRCPVPLLWYLLWLCIIYCENAEATFGITLQSISRDKMKNPSLTVLRHPSCRWRHWRPAFPGTSFPGRWAPLSYSADRKASSARPPRPNSAVLFASLAEAANNSSARSGMSDNERIVPLFYPCFKRILTFLIHLFCKFGNSLWICNQKEFSWLFFGHYQWKYTQTLKNFLVPI